MKLRNIAPDAVTAVKVRLSAFDAAGNQLGEDTVFSYLDMKIARDEENGQKTPIPLPDKNIRSYVPAVIEVVFESGEVWNSDGKSPAEPLPVQQTMTFESAELKKQYQLEVSRSAEYALLETKDLWFCTCGAVNRSDEETCHKCSAKHTLLKDADFDALKEHRDARLAEERAAKEAAEKKAAEEKAEQDRAAAEQAEAERLAAKKRKTVIGIVAAVIVVAAVAVLVVDKVVIPKNRYNSAVALMESGEYDMIITLEKIITHESGNFCNS